MPTLGPEDASPPNYMHETICQLIDLFLLNLSPSNNVHLHIAYLQKWYYKWPKRKVGRFL
jgi:hypothetical protein